MDRCGNHQEWWPASLAPTPEKTVVRFNPERSKRLVRQELGTYPHHPKPREIRPERPPAYARFSCHETPNLSVSQPNRVLNP